MIGLSNTPVLETERLVLRAPQHGDFDAWLGFATAPRSKTIGGPLTRELAWRAMGHLTGHWVHRGFGMFFFCLKGSDTPIGMTGPWRPEGWPEPEIGWSVWSEAAEGKGLAFEAATAARAYAFDVLGWPTAVSYIHPDNVRSIALARRLGATLDGDAQGPGHDPCLVYRHPAPGGRA